MDIPEAGARYLNVLYLKTKSDITNGYDGVTIAKLAGFDKEQANTIKDYLKETGLIEQQSKADTRVILSSSGIDRVLKWRENRIFKTIKFTRSQYLPPDENATYDFIYSYELTDENGKAEKKTIKVSISDVLSMIWRFKESDLEMILLQFAKDEVIQKIKTDTLNDAESLVILRKNYPDKCPYKLENIVELKLAEFEIEMKQKMPTAEIKKLPTAEPVLNPFAITSWIA